MAKVSVIVISYNTKEITDRCLAAIFASRNVNELEVIAVDNASTDGSVAMINKKYPQVKLISSKVNTGFTGGNNLAMKQATGEYFLLLNSDAFLQPETIEMCQQFMLHHKDCSVLGCKLTYENGRLQPSAGFLPNPINTFLWVWGIDVFPVLKNVIPSVHPQYTQFFDKTRVVGWVTGAFMFMKRQVYDQTGGFDEKYFMYTEEVDWCKRMQVHNFKVYYAANFSVVHIQAASSDNRKPFIKEMQGLVYYFKKHYPYLASIMKQVIKLGNVARIVAFEVVGKKDRADIYREIVGSL